MQEAIYEVAELLVPEKRHAKAEVRNIAGLVKFVIENQLP
ncbi:MAG: hypothetical protein K0S33_4095 [Bacteroidetes bacterium]|jgi:hypothetical protein|nr:hypothetical protein [Bacteroidota bacterium]